MQTIVELIARAAKLKQSPLEVVERIHDGRIADIKPPIKRKIAPFVEAIRALRSMAVAGAGPDAIVRRLLKLVQYEEHLKKHHEDWETRWENVEELVNFASEFEYEPLPVSPVPARASATKPAKRVYADHEEEEVDDEDWDADSEEADELFEGGDAPSSAQTTYVSSSCPIE